MHATLFHCSEMKAPQSGLVSDGEENPAQRKLERIAGPVGPQSSNAMSDCKMAVYGPHLACRYIFFMVHTGF